MLGNFLQAVAAAALALTGILKSTKRRDGGLNTFGWMLLIAGGSLTIIGTRLDKISAYRTEDALRVQIETLQQTEKALTDRIDKLYRQMAEQVEELSPKGEPKPTTQPRTETRQISITWPKEGSKADARQLVQGTVLNPDERVWVIVHPLNVTAYWVQPPVTVRSDGAWSVMVYLGGAGDTDKEFEIMAVANPKVSLHEADMLSDWPATEDSVVIQVRRK